jgi:hypothetical protein
MKPSILKSLTIVAVSIGGLLLADSVHAQVTGINTPDQFLRVDPIQ